MKANESDGDLVGYPLQRDTFSSIRLYLQHWLRNRELEYFLHPTIPIAEGTLIADVACGNCAWIIDVARTHPEAQIHGFDISAAQHPHQNWLPKNIQLSTLDLFEPVRDDLCGKYDVVHVGLLALVVQHDNPIPILEKLSALLKPGGYLQWDEVDVGDVHVNSPNAQVSCTALEQLGQKCDKLYETERGTRFSWTRSLGAAFQAQGLSVLDDKLLPIKDDIAHPWSLIHLMVAVELINLIERRHGTEDARVWWELYDRAAAEVRQGATMRVAMVSIVGQKSGPD
ncbi:MAG: hypothetical protein Q9169_006971 [Polycauliona sp. 2 TL-2023]